MKRTTTTLSAVALAVIALSACGTTRTAAPTSQGTLPTPTLATSTPTTTAPPPPPASATPSVTTSTPAAARITTYPGDGVQVVKAADVRKLTGTSEAFRSFIAVTAKRAAADGRSCPDAFHGVTVEKYSTAGYAIGGVNYCGGYEALWVLEDGSWIQGMGTQDAWDCTTLRYLGVPRSFAGKCFAEGGGFGPTGNSDLIQLGDPDTALAKTGATLTDMTPGDASCQFIHFPGSPTRPGGDGQFQVGRGVVELDARPGDITPEKVTLGSTLAQVRAAYPALRRASDADRPPRSRTSRYVFMFSSPDGHSGTVTQLLLQLVRPNTGCAG